MSLSKSTRFSTNSSGSVTPNFINSSWLKSPNISSTLCTIQKTMGTTIGTLTWDQIRRAVNLVWCVSFRTRLNMKAVSFKLTRVRLYVRKKTRVLWLFFQAICCTGWPQWQRVPGAHSSCGSKDLHSHDRATTVSGSGRRNAPYTRTLSSRCNRVDFKPTRERESICYRWKSVRKCIRHCRPCCVGQYDTLVVLTACIRDSTRSRRTQICHVIGRCPVKTGDGLVGSIGPAKLIPTLGRGHAKAGWGSVATRLIPVRWQGVYYEKFSTSVLSVSERDVLNMKILYISPFMTTSLVVLPIICAVLVVCHQLLDGCVDCNVPFPYMYLFVPSHLNVTLLPVAYVPPLWSLPYQ